MKHKIKERSLKVCLCKEIKSSLCHSSYEIILKCVEISCSNCLLDLRLYLGFDCPGAGQDKQRLQLTILKSFQTVLVLKFVEPKRQKNEIMR